MKPFRGRIYRDSGGRLKIVFDRILPWGRRTILITKVDGEDDSIELQAFITANDPYRSKCRIPPIPNLKPLSTVEGYIAGVDEQAIPRCRWCGRHVSGTINGLCDDCLIELNTPHKPEEGWGAVA
jgi:hypothetical protein